MPLALKTLRRKQRSSTDDDAKKLVERAARLLRERYSAAASVHEVTVCLMPPQPCAVKGCAEKDHYRSQFSLSMKGHGVKTFSVHQLHLLESHCLVLPVDVARAVESLFVFACDE